MNKGRAAWNAGRQSVINRTGRIVVAAVGLLVSAWVFSAPADVNRGLAWLQTQVQADGSVAGSSGVAAPQQVQCETAATLIKLAGDSAQVAALVVALEAGDRATETVACWQKLRQRLGQSGLASNLEQRRVAQQAYGAYEAFGTANALDTGWALSTQLENLSAEDKSGLLTWLQGRQSADGSFVTAGRADLQASAVVLRGVTGEASKNTTAAAIATKAAGWLMAQRDAQGHWLDDVATTAIVFEAVHPYSAADPAMASGVESYLLARQGADGSWAGDPYVTAVALRALALVPVVPLSPTQSGLKVRFVDARTGIGVAGIVVTGSGQQALSGTADASGALVIAGAAAGSYQFVASAEGFATVTISATLEAGRLLDVGTVQLIASANSTTAVFSGTVRDRDSNQPIAGATVELVEQGRTAFTGPDGNYLISDVVPGAIAFTVRKAGYLSVAGTGQAVAGQMLNFSPALSADTGGAASGADCRVAGVVRDAASGLPVAGVAITIAGANSGVASTDAAGAYAVSSLAGGALIIGASKNGYDTVTASTQLVCRTSYPTTVEFSPRLYPTNETPANANTATLRGVVMDAGTNQPIAGAQVSVVPELGLPRSAQSQADGRFSIAGLDGASVQLHIKATGYQELTAQYALALLQESDLGQLRLRAAKVEQLLPDFKVVSVQRATAKTDVQTLQLSGAVQVALANVGTQSAPTNAEVVAFSDVNRDGRFDPAVDTRLGQSTLSEPLTPGQTVTLQISVAGTLPFRDAPISVAVDPNHQVAEISRSDDVKSTADAALIQPEIGTFKPVLKWQWTGAGAPYPGYNQVMMAPVVGPLLDTNSDGRIDGADVPVVVFTTFSGNVWGTYDKEGVIRVVHGGTGAELLTIKEPTAEVSGVGNLAVADLDGDGKPEIIAIKLDGGLVVFRNNGSKWWMTPALHPFNNSWYCPCSSWGAPLVADLDGDGKPEVVFGRYVYSFDGVRKWAANTSYVGGAGWGRPQSPMAVAADLDLTGTQSLLIGPSVHAADGRMLWSNGTVPDGFVAIGNFNADPYPEIVVSGEGKVSLLDRQGKLLWQVTTPGAKFGGPPTIADMDGDGVPEIGVANATRYTVFRADGSVLWSAPSQDASSYMTGSTVFDFNGDGRAEVLYGDEVSIRAFNGANGAAIWSIPNSTATTHEYPIVADVDRDGHADLVTIANDYAYIENQTVRTHGIRVFRDEKNSWVNVRSVWNQHAYSITNVNDDLTIPAKPQPSWQAHNTFRANKRLEGSPLAVADATVSYLRVTDAGGAGSRLTVRVGNGGALATPVGMKVAFYAGAAGGTRLGVVSMSKVLAAGEYEDLTLSVTSSLATVPSVTIVVDDDGTGKSTISDFDRSNNAMVADLSAISTHLVVTVAADKSVYTEADQAIFTAPVRNAGSFARDAVVRFTVMDVAGDVVEVLPLSASVSVPASGSASVQVLWSVAGTLSGEYQVQAELISPAGVVYGTARANFTVTASQSQTALARINADRVSYSAAQTVQLTSRVANATANTPLENVQARTEVKSALGQSVLSRIEAIEQLAPSGSRQYSYSLAASGLSAGSYQASVQLLGADGVVLAQSATSFSVLGADQSGVGLTGQLQASPPTLFIGQGTQLGLKVTNNSATSLSQVPITVRLIDPVAGNLVASFSATVADWPAGQTLLLNFDWSAVGAPGQILVAAASAQLAGMEVPLGQTNVKVLGILFTGNLGADPVEVEAGTNVALNYNVANPTPVAGRMQGQLGVQTQSGQSLATWPLDLRIGGAASFAGNQLYTTGEPLQTLTAVLSQQLGADSVVLATTQFKVIDPPVPLTVTAGVKGQARILVLVSCPPGLGAKEDAACVAQRMQAITSYFMSLGMTAKTVSTGADFLAEMRCGSYNTYWISNGAIKLDPQTIGELSQAVHRGEALWVDGVHDSRNQLLHPVAGVKQTGKLPTPDQVASLAETGLYGVQSLPTLGLPTEFQLIGGQAQGLFTQVPGQPVTVPAVVSNEHGQGKSLLFAFDLAGMITGDALQAGSQLAVFVSTSAAHAASTKPTLTVGDLAQLSASITNEGTRTVLLRAEATLPLGLTSVSTSPQAQLTTHTDGTVKAVWEFSLAARASREIVWMVRAQEAGSYSAPLSVYSLPKAGSSQAPKLRANAAMTLQVSDAQSLLAQPLVAAQALQPTQSSDQNALVKAQAAIAKAQALHAQGQYEQAIVQWLAAAEALATIGSADTSEAKAAVALAIEASTDALCMQRCGQAACQ